ncbi:MAG: DUF1080 domain-containing protein [Planctomycetota bacterium]
MNTLRTAALASVALLTACAHTPPNTLTGAEESAGFQLLFDGSSLEHWRNYKSDTISNGWEVRDGAIHRGGPAGDIVTREQYEDFELYLDWKIAPGGNSGIFFHVTEDHDYVFETGPEYQILDNKNHPDGADPKTSAGSDYALYAPRVDATNTTGAYNRSRIVVRGGHVRHYLNGELVVEYELWSDDWYQRVAASKFASMPDYGMRRSGHIALQDHGDEVWFRNIKIRRL